MDRKIIVTEDNSKTLLIPAMNETYHSTKGAFNEALHVFIDAGLAFLPPKNEIRIFEMGFGTGLNALVTLNSISEQNLNINYTSIEKYPLKLDLVKQLNYPELFNNQEILQLNERIHEAEWEIPVPITSNFTLRKLNNDLNSLTLEPKSFDLIYYDAFGPKVQPELWSVSTLKKMYDILDNHGVLVTYCAQGQFKRNLKTVGFKVENLPGPPGKREMTRAIKRID